MPAFLDRAEVGAVNSRVPVSRARRERPAPPCPAESWKRFARHQWEQSPAVIQQAGATPLLSPEEVFHAYVSASDAFRAGDENVRIYFYIDHAQVVADVGKHLPVTKDRTAARYAQRIRRQLDGRRFALIVQEAQAHHAPLWLRLREFQREFEEGSGISGRGAKATLFLGDYETTPFGLHRGNSNVFKFVIAGRKRIRLWPDTFMRAQGGVQHSLDCERWGDAPFSLEGGPGDLLYWPPDFWHVGECIGGLTISLSLALFHRSQPSAEEDLAGCAVRSVGPSREGADREIGSHFDPQRLAERASAVPKILARTITTLQQAVDQPDVHEALKVLWLNRASSFGFRAVPPPRPHQALTDDTWVKGDPHFPIICLPGDRAEILCSANGHAFAVAAHPHMIKLLGRLNEGKPCRVGSLLKRSAGSLTVDGIVFEATPEDIRAVLEKLCSLRAINTTPIASRKSLLTAKSRTNSSRRCRQRQTPPLLSR